jgi:hypothetical protein
LDISILLTILEHVRIFLQRVQSRKDGWTETTTENQKRKENVVRRSKENSLDYKMEKEIEEEI